MSLDGTTLGGRLRTARIAAGASARQLADKLGVVHSAVHHWECGRRTMAAETVKRCARLLGVSVRWLVGLSLEGGPGTYAPSTFKRTKGGRPRLPRRGSDGRYCQRVTMPDPDGPDFEDPRQLLALPASLAAEPALAE